MGDDCGYTLPPVGHNDRAMVRWICNVKANDKVSLDTVLSKLGFQDTDVVLHFSRM